MVAVQLALLSIEMDMLVLILLIQVLEALYTWQSSTHRSTGICPSF